MSATTPGGMLSDVVKVMEPLATQPMPTWVAGQSRSPQLNQVALPPLLPHSLSRPVRPGPILTWFCLAPTLQLPHLHRSSEDAGSLRLCLAVRLPRDDPPQSETSCADPKLLACSPVEVLETLLVVVCSAHLTVSRS